MTSADSDNGETGDLRAVRSRLGAAAGPGPASLREEHPALGAARRLAAAADRPVTDGIRSASAVIPHLAAAADEISSIIQVIADAPAVIDLPTRVWLNEAADHARDGEGALDQTVADVAGVQGGDDARQVHEAAAGLLERLYSRPLDEASLAALVPLIEVTVDAVSSDCDTLLDLFAMDPADAIDLGNAADHLLECSARLSDAQGGLEAAARDARVARGAEAAWAAGAAHGRAGRPPAITRARGVLALSGEDGAAVAASLGTGPEMDSTAAAAAVAAYCDAHAEAASGPGGSTVTRGRYVPGQEVTTAMGRSGVLTGDAGPGERPRVRFSDGHEETVPREAIRAPLAHVLAGMPGPEGVPCAAAGDVVLVVSGRIVPWVQTAEGLRPACRDTATLGRRRCEYEDSVRLAEKAMGLASGSLFSIDQYTPPFDPGEYGGNPFPGWTRGEIEQQWDRPPGSLRAFDYGTESHSARVASQIARLGFPALPAVAPPPGRSRKGPASAGPAAGQSASHQPPRQ